MFCTLRVFIDIREYATHEEQGKERETGEEAGGVCGQERERKREK